jgi:hypothetical protein
MPLNPGSQLLPVLQIVMDLNVDPSDTALVQSVTSYYQAVYAFYIGVTPDQVQIVFETVSFRMRKLANNFVFSSEIPFTNLQLAQTALSSLPVLNFTAILNSPPSGFPNPQNFNIPLTTSFIPTTIPTPQIVFKVFAAPSPPPPHSPPPLPSLPPSLPPPSSPPSPFPPSPPRAPDLQIALTVDNAIEQHFVNEANPLVLKVVDLNTLEIEGFETDTLGYTPVDNRPPSPSRRLSETTCNPKKYFLISSKLGELYDLCVLSSSQFTRLPYLRFEKIKGPLRTNYIFLTFFPIIGLVLVLGFVSAICVQLYKCSLSNRTLKIRRLILTNKTIVPTKNTTPKVKQTVVENMDELNKIENRWNIENSSTVPLPQVFKKEQEQKYKHIASGKYSHIKVNPSK